MELLFKTTNKSLPTDEKYLVRPRGGQLLDIRPDGFFSESTRRHLVVVRVPLDFKKYLGRDDNVIRAHLSERDLELARYLMPTNKDGKYIDQVADGEAKDLFQKGYFTDWFVDFKDLFDLGLISYDTFTKIYTKNEIKPTIEIDSDFRTFLKREGEVQRITSDFSDRIGSYVSGTVGVGSDEDPGGYTAWYNTWASALADMAATLEGNVDIVGHRAETTAESSSAIIDTNANGYSITCRPNSGVRHGGIAGNGHIIQAATYGRAFTLQDVNLDEVAIQDLAYDCQTNMAYDAVYGLDCGGPFIVQRNLIYGDSSTYRGIYLYGYVLAATSVVRNNIVYGCTKSGDGYGIFGFTYTSGSPSFYFYNNSCCKNNIGIKVGTGLKTTLVAINNLCQGNATDYGNPDQYTYTAHNVSYDNTSPDEDYRGKDKTAVFTNYAGNVYSLASADTDLDDGSDLSGIGSPNQFGDDAIEVTRSTWYIGAFEYVAGGTTTTTAAPTTTTTTAAPTTTTTTAAPTTTTTTAAPTTTTTTAAPTTTTTTAAPTTTTTTAAPTTTTTTAAPTTTTTTPAPTTTTTTAAPTTTTPEPTTTSSSTLEPTTSSSSTPEPTTSSSSTPEPTTTSSTPEPTTSSSSTPEPTTSSSSTPEPTTSSSSTPEPTTSTSSTEEPITTSSTAEATTSTEAPSECDCIEEIAVVDAKADQIIIKLNQIIALLS